MKCPNCGKINTVRGIPLDGNKYDMHLYIPQMPKRKLYAVRYRCDNALWHKTGRGCGCVWEVNYKVTIEKLPITIIEKEKNDA